MSTKTELKAKPHEIICRLKGVELKPTPDGRVAYKVIVSAPFQSGYSKFPTEMFIRGSELVNAKEMYDWLAKQPKESILKLRVAPGKVKQGKQDDGELSSYFWNLVGVPTGAWAGAPVAVPAAKDEETPLFPENEPPVKGTERARPKDYWDAKDALISMSWAIQEARAVVMAYHGGDKMGGWRPEFWDNIKQEIADLAPRFLAMRDYLLGQGEKE